jgi:uncharacterized membrane protein
MLGTIIIGIILYIVVSSQNRKIHELNAKLDRYLSSGKQVENKQEEAMPASLPIANIVETPIYKAEYENKPEAEKYYEESSGKILGKIGIAALILGVGFFLKYAFDNDWIGPIGRVLIGVLIGIILISIGQYFRKKYETFSEVMFGGGIVVLYLSFYAAHSFYNLINPLNTGILMVLVTASTFVFSFVNKDNKLAILAVIGGFVTPYIIGATGNNMTEIFAYLTILNVGVLAITIFKKWPQLIALALVGTAINFFSWSIAFYNESFLRATVFFLILTFIIFFIASLYRIIIEKVKSSEVDYFLLLVNGFGFYGIFYSIVKVQHESMLGLYTLILAIVYIIVAYWANKKNYDDKALNIFLPGMAVAFLSIAIPIQFSGAYIAILWFVEACVLYFMAVSMTSRGFQVMGLCVYALGLINFFGWNASNYGISSFAPFMNKAFGILVIAVISAYIISYIYHKYGSVSAEVQKNGIILFVIVANILTLYALSTQIIFYYNAQNNILAKNYESQVRILNQSQNQDQYGNSYNYGVNTNTYHITQTANKNKSNTSVSILWAIYAVIITVIGFAKRNSSLRIFGLTLFIITAIKVFVDVWSLGQLYRIISFIGLGIIALVASFIYVKYKDRLKVI